jgi:hypothetical protein
MTDKLPWDEITVPSGGYNWLRTDLSAKYRFWWGRSSNGWPILLLELDENHTEIFRRQRPKVKGLDIDLVALTDRAKQGLIVSLQRPTDADIFYRLCTSIIYAASEAAVEGQAVLSVLNHLERWKDFLANARKRLLSVDEIRGLFAELTMIQTFVDEYQLDKEKVVSAWQGPLRKPQDFQFPEVAVEVKAFGSSHGTTVQISSEQQLQAVGTPLYLVAVELFDTSADSSSSSLNRLVRGVEGLLAGNAARTFRDRLAITDYADLPEYDLMEFAVGRIETYRVEDGFPAIRSADLPSGISKVRYDLDLNTARAFLVSRIPTWNPS